MSELEAALERLRAHPGVDHLILLGRDGLVIKHLGSGGREEPIAARVPGLTSACASLGSVAGIGDFNTAVLEFDGGVAIVTALSPELLMTLLLRPAVGFSQLLRELRRERVRLIQLL